MPEAFIIERYKFDHKAYEAYLVNGGTKRLKAEDVERYGDSNETIIPHNIPNILANDDTLPR